MKLLRRQAACRGRWWWRSDGADTAAPVWAGEWVEPVGGKNPLGQGPSQRRWQRWRKEKKWRWKMRVEEEEEW